MVVLCACLINFSASETEYPFKWTIFISSVVIIISLLFLASIHAIITLAIGFQGIASDRALILSTNADACGLDENW